MTDLANLRIDPAGVAQDSVKRIADFHTEALVRQDDLGAKGAFHGAVDPANRLKTLFSRLPLDALEEFPKNELKQISDQANGIFNLFTQILEFDPDAGEPATRRDLLISQLESQYQPLFATLMPFISYAVARTVDWDQLAADGRVAVQSVRDEAASIVSELEITSSDASRVLHEVREAAAEQGVTQMAKYFETEAEIHEKASEYWKYGTLLVGAVVLAYAVFSLFFPQFEFLKANTVSEAIQLTVSKVLIFFVLVSMLLLFIKNFSAHKHNTILNRHRQNALMTYTTLAEAGNSPEARDTVLQHAAAAIYAPSDTGYVKNDERGYSGSMPVALTPRLAAGASSADG